jgi:hypothetical protein
MPEEDNTKEKNLPVNDIDMDIIDPKDIELQEPKFAPFLAPTIEEDIDFKNDIEGYNIQDTPKKEVKRILDDKLKAFHHGKFSSVEEGKIKDIHFDNSLSKVVISINGSGSKETENALINLFGGKEVVNVKEKKYIGSKISPDRQIVIPYKTFQSQICQNYVFKSKDTFKRHIQESINTKFATFKGRVKDIALHNIIDNEGKIKRNLIIKFKNLSSTSQETLLKISEQSGAESSYLASNIISMPEDQWLDFFPTGNIDDFIKKEDNPSKDDLEKGITAFYDEKHFEKSQCNQLANLMRMMNPNIWTDEMFQFSKNFIDNSSCFKSNGDVSIKFDFVTLGRFYEKSGEKAVGNLVECFEQIFEINNKGEYITFPAEELRAYSSIVKKIYECQKDKSKYLTSTFFGIEEEIIKNAEKKSDNFKKIIESFKEKKAEIEEKIKEEKIKLPEPVDSIDLSNVVDLEDIEEIDTYYKGIGIRGIVSEVDEEGANKTIIKEPQIYSRSRMAEFIKSKNMENDKFEEIIISGQSMNDIINAGIEEDSKITFKLSDGTIKTFKERIGKGDVLSDKTAKDLIKRPGVDADLTDSVPYEKAEEPKRTISNVKLESKQKEKGVE